MPPRQDTKQRKSLAIDLGSIRRELQESPSLSGSDVLGSLEGLYRSKEHRYRRVDDFTIFHVMDYEALQPYQLRIERPDLVCVQIMLTGKYLRRTPDWLHPVGSAMTHITNYPQSMSETAAGQILRGIWIACDRRHFVSRFGVRAERVPAEYLSIFESALGMPNALEMPTLAANIVAVEEVLSCRLEEPLNSLYVNAKVTEILCNVVAQLHAMGVKGHRHRSVDTGLRLQAIEAAAEIYRRDISRPPTIEKLAFRVGLNRNELTAGFRERFGTTPSAYGHALRMEQARALLKIEGLSISDVARRVGYGSYASFARAYAAHHGQPPSTAR